MNLVDFLVLLTLYAPGYVVVSALTKRETVSRKEALLIGFALWEFLLVSVETVVGLFSNLMVPFLMGFSVLGALIVSYGVGRLAFERLLRNRRTFAWLPSQLKQAKGENLCAFFLIGTLMPSNIDSCACSHDLPRI